MHIFCARSFAESGDNSFLKEYNIFQIKSNITADKAKKVLVVAANCAITTNAFKNYSVSKLSLAKTSESCAPHIAP